MTTDVNMRIATNASALEVLDALAMVFSKIGEAIERGEASLKIRGLAHESLMDSGASVVDVSIHQTDDGWLLTGKIAENTRAGWFLLGGAGLLYTGVRGYLLLFLVFLALLGFGIYRISTHGSSLKKVVLESFEFVGNELSTPQDFRLPPMPSVASEAGEGNNQAFAHDDSGVKDREDPHGPAVLANDAYKIFLVSRYGIKRNDALNALVCANKLFPDIESALEHADSLYRKHLAAREEARARAASEKLEREQQAKAEAVEREQHAKTEAAEHERQLQQLRAVSNAAAKKAVRPFLLRMGLWVLALVGAFLALYKIDLEFPSTPEARESYRQQEILFERMLLTNEYFGFGLGQSTLTEVAAKLGVEDVVRRSRASGLEETEVRCHTKGEASSSLDVPCGALVDAAVFDPDSSRLYLMFRFCRPLGSTDYVLQLVDISLGENDSSRTRLLLRMIQNLIDRQSRIENEWKVPAGVKQNLGIGTDSMEGFYKIWVSRSICSA